MQISLFQGVGLHVDGREVALRGRKAQALIAYLVLSPGMKATREQLVGLLWSEAEDAKARASLRQLLHVLRVKFERAGVVGLSIDKLRVSLDESVFVTDLDRALASVDRGEPVDLLGNEPRITDSLLPGYDDLDPSFTSWVRIKRESVRQQLIRKLEEQLADTSYGTTATKRIARTLFQVDPGHEIACQQLMRSYVDSGNVGGALNSYKRLWQYLEEEYDVEPSVGTQELVVAIKSGSYRPPVTYPDLVTSKGPDRHGETVDPIIVLAARIAAAWIAMCESAVRPA